MYSFSLDVYLKIIEKNFVLLSLFESKKIILIQHEDYINQTNEIIPSYPFHFFPPHMHLKNLCFLQLLWIQ